MNPINVSPAPSVQDFLRRQVSWLGEYILFVGSVLRSGRRFFHRWELFLAQCEFIGVSSLVVVIISALFLGGVFSFQLSNTLKLFGAQAMLGGGFGVTIFREMGPVMTAFMVLGRAGAGMAAEIATMKVSEQLDAIEVMAVDPIEYLAMPRIAAGVLMVPLLAVFFAGVAALSGEFIGCGLMGLDPATYWQQFARWVDFLDIYHLLIKASCFGFVLTTVACFYGFRAQGGASAVGQATRSTVVTGLLLILLTDYLITSLLPHRAQLSVTPGIFNFI